MGVQLTCGQVAACYLFGVGRLLGYMIGWSCLLEDWAAGLNVPPVSALLRELGEAPASELGAFQKEMRCFVLWVKSCLAPVL